MKKLAYILSSAILLFSCTGEINPGGNTPEDKPATDSETGISLDKAKCSIKEGESVTLIVTLTPDNATNKTVVWSSGNKTVATVDDNGKVTGIKAGNATITATTQDGGKTATCQLTVEENLAPSVTLSAERITAVSATLKGEANLENAQGSVNLGFQYCKSGESSASSVQTVLSENAGNSLYSVAISELEPDTSYKYWSFVRIDGKDICGETKEFTTKDFDSLLETMDASDVTISEARLNARLDKTYLQDAYKDISYGFNWGTSKESLDNKISGGTFSNNKIYFSWLNSLSLNTQYWYNAYLKLDGHTYYGDVKPFAIGGISVGSVYLNKNEYTFNFIGASITLKATVLPSTATDKSVSWTSTNPAVASVDQTGEVTARSKGFTRITVTTNDQGKTASCAITVSSSYTPPIHH